MLYVSLQTPPLYRRYTIIRLIAMAGIVSLPRRFITKPLASLLSGFLKTLQESCQAFLEPYYVHLIKISDAR